MNGRTKIFALAATLTAVLAGPALLWPAPAPEPAYEGKTLSYWLEEIESDPKSIRGPGGAAVLNIGTNSIPFLLQMLRAHDSSLKSRLLIWASTHPALRIHYTDSKTLNVRAYYGFTVLGPDAAIAVPGLIKVLDLGNSDRQVALAAGALARIGAPSEPAIPALLRAATRADADVHNSVFNALGAIHSNPGESLPILIEGLRDPAPLNHEIAAAALGNFGSRAKAALPALIAAVDDPALQASDPQLFTNVLIQVQGAIRRIDPVTYHQVVTNPISGP
jgi:hypothetical protein